MVHGNKLDPKKRIRVIVFGDPERFGLIIEDQGEGFGAKSVPDPNHPRAHLRERGRGILLIAHYMEQVRYNAKSKRLWLSRKKQLRPDPGARKPRELPPAKEIPVIMDLTGIDLTVPEVRAASSAARISVPDDIDLELAAVDDLVFSSEDEAAPSVDPGAVVAVHQRDGVVIARFQTPRLTEDNAAEVRKSLQQAIAHGKGLVLDMAEVEFMSSVGISTLLKCAKAGDGRKKRIVLASMGPGLAQHVLKATGLFTLLPDRERIRMRRSRKSKNRSAIQGSLLLPLAA